MALFHFSLFFHCVYVHILFTYSYDNGHLGAFHILAIVNSAAMDNVVHISFQISVCVFFFFYFEMSPGIEMLNHVAVAFWAF